mgnify:CR=1 FL=1
MKNILIINGHPNPESFCAAIVDRYVQGAARVTSVKTLHIHKLDFNPNLQYGYEKRTELEPDLLEAQRLIKWADHLVWVYPLWWGGVPAILKGFLDRTFLPGFAFQKRENSVWWDKYLTGKSARIICTMDQPYWYYWLINGRPTQHAMKKMTLEFCGIKPVRTTNIGPIRLSKDAYREKWLRKIEQLATSEAVN